MGVLLTEVFAPEFQYIFEIDTMSGSPMILSKICSIPHRNDSLKLDRKCFGYAAAIFLGLVDQLPDPDRLAPVLGPDQLRLVNRLQDEHQYCSHTMPESLGDFSAQTVASTIDCKEALKFTNQFLAVRELLFISVWRDTSPGHTFLLDNRLPSTAWIYDSNFPGLCRKLPATDTVPELVRWLNRIVSSDPTVSTRIALEAILLQRDAV